MVGTCIKLAFAIAYATGAMLLIKKYEQKNNKINY